MENGVSNISRQAMQRLPYYLQFLKQLESSGEKVVSSPLIAEKFGLKEIQVRKDLAIVSSVSGKPRIGFEISRLIDDMENVLGYNEKNETVLIGVGSLGTALLSYKGFYYYGLNIVAAFDSDPDKVGKTVGGKPVLAISELSDYCRTHQIHIGIITVPAEHAQQVADLLIKGSIQAIWNFAPTYLSTPSSILVQNESMAASLAILSKHLKEKQH
jgi:redox-sensing transcriptional repressor